MRNSGETAKKGQSPATKKDRMRAMPFFFSTRFFILLAAVSALLVPVYVYHPSGLWAPAVADALLLLVAMVDFFSAPRLANIHVRRPLPFPLAVDRPNEIVLEVDNITGSSQTIVVRDDVPERCFTRDHPVWATVRPGSGTRLSYRLIPMERGNGEFSDLHFWVRCPMGLVWRHGVASAKRTVKLYPGLALVERARMRIHVPAVGDMSRAIHRRGQGTEFDSLREYGVGDDSRLIHWPTTARRGKLIVRLNRIERSQIVFLVLDAGRMMTARVLGKTKLDHGLDAALLVAYTALELGDRVGMMAVAQNVEAFVPPSKFPGQFGRMLDATYALAPKMEEPRFHTALPELSTRLKRRALVMIFTDLIDERASEGLLRYSLGLLPRHLPIVVAMSDTEIVNLANAMPEEKADVYRQGVAAEILLRRERLLAKLSSAGVMVMDAAPEKISAAILDRYLEIKTRNLL